MRPSKPLLPSLRNINSIRPANSQAVVSLFSAYSPSTATAKKPVDIVDPYYGNGMSGFERCYGQCIDYSNGFLDQVEQGELKSGDKVKKAGL
jgi:low molecular weight phosphotyrosine protein phosphatase